MKSKARCCCHLRPYRRDYGLVWHLHPSPAAFALVLRPTRCKIEPKLWRSGKVNLLHEARAGCVYPKDSEKNLLTRTRFARTWRPPPLPSASCYANFLKPIARNPGEKIRVKVTFTSSGQRPITPSTPAELVNRSLGRL